MPELGDRLTADLTFLALCWRLLRRDGVALGFTNHDRPLAFGGLLYDSAPGMAPSAIVQGDGLEIDTMDIAGALSAGALTADDLVAGRWDGAAVTLSLVDWRDPGGASLELARGSLGDIAAGEGNDPSFTATIDGPTAALQATLVETCSPECRAELGDWRCRVAMRGRTVRAVVSGVSPLTVSVAGDLAAYVEGRLRAVDGPAAGLDTRISGVDGTGLSTDDVLPVAPGDRVELTQGCDRRFATCRDRFANAANFRGEPHVPGSDLLTRFPGV